MSWGATRIAAGLRRLPGAGRAEGQGGEDDQRQTEPHRRNALRTGLGYLHVNLPQDSIP